MRARIISKLQPNCLCGVFAVVFFPVGPLTITALACHIMPIQQSYLFHVENSPKFLFEFSCFQSAYSYYTSIHFLYDFFYPLFKHTVHIYSFLVFVTIFKLVRNHSLKMWIHEKVNFIYHSMENTQAFWNLYIDTDEFHSINRLCNAWCWRIALWALGTQTAENRGYLYCNIVVFYFLLQNSVLLSHIFIVLKSTMWGHC